MARVLVVVPAGKNVGITSVALGLIQACVVSERNVLFAKPLTQPGLKQEEADYTVDMIELVTGKKPPEPISGHTVERRLADGETAELLEEVVAHIAPLHHQAEVIIVEGFIQSGGFHFYNELNRQLIETLDAGCGIGRRCQSGAYQM